MSAIITMPMAPPPPRTPWQELRSRFVESWVASVALALFACLIVVAVLAPWIAPQNPYDLSVVSVMNAELRPGEADMNGQFHLLGTDGAGRDLLSAILYGLRVSIGVGITSAVVALLVGTVYGLMAALFGGRIDALLMRIVDLQLSFPAILVALVLLAALGQGVDKTLMALIIVQWAFYARTVRAAAMVERHKDYVEAAMGQGLSSRLIMFRHILPNCIEPLMVTITLQTAHAITLEATLSFLGIGLPQTQPSLGLLIANGHEYMMSHKFWISLYPGLALVLLVVSINLTGDRLRTVLDPKNDR